MNTTHPLRQYRDEHGVSAAVMGERLGLTRQSIHRIENGEQSPSSDTLRRVSDATEGVVTPNHMIAAMPPVSERVAS